MISKTHHTIFSCMNAHQNHENDEKSVVNSRNIYTTKAFPCSRRHPRLLINLKQAKRKKNNAQESLDSEAENVPHFVEFFFSSVDFYSSRVVESSRSNLIYKIFLVRSFLILFDPFCLLNEEKILARTTNVIWINSRCVFSTNRGSKSVVFLNLGVLIYLFFC